MGVWDKAASLLTDTVTVICVYIVFRRCIPFVPTEWYRNYAKKSVVDESLDGYEEIAQIFFSFADT